MALSRPFYSSSVRPFVRLLPAALSGDNNEKTRSVYSCILMRVCSECVDICRAPEIVIPKLHAPMHF